MALTYTFRDVLERLPPGVSVENMTMMTILETSAFWETVRLRLAPAMTSKFFLESQSNSGNNPDFRQYGVEGDEGRIGPDEEQTTELKPMSRSYSTDRLLVDVPTRDNANATLDWFQRTAKYMSLNGKRAVVNSTAVGAPRSLYSWVDQYNTAINVVKIPFGDGSGQSFATVGVSGTVDAINRLIDACNGLPDYIYINRRLLSLLDGLRLSNNNAPLATMFRWGVWTSPVTGRQYRTAYWGGGNGGGQEIPLIPMDRDSQSAEILQFNELSADLSDSACSSMVAVRWGDEDAAVLQKFVGGPRVFPYVQNGHQYFGMDWPLGVEVRSRGSVVRLTGITVS